MERTRYQSRPCLIQCFDYSCQESIYLHLKCHYCYGGSRLRNKERQQIYPELELAMMEHDFVKLPEDLNYDMFIVSGGEILFDDFSIKLIEELIDRTMPGQSSISLVTNGTIFNRDIIDKCKAHFKQVEITVSIDAYGSANDYLRYPSDFNTIITNLLSYRDMDIYVNVASVVSNISLISIPDLINWCSIHDIDHHIRLLVEPDIFSPNNITSKLKDYVTANIQNVESKKKQVLIDAMHNNTNDMSDIMLYLQKHDKHREIDVYNYIPALKNLL